jgi:PAS domain S-box-containing protein
LPLIIPTIERELNEVELRRQRWQAEEERRISEEKFFKAFHNSPDAINLSRLTDGLYLEINEGAEKLSGYKAEELIGQSSINLNIWAEPVERDRLGTKMLRDGKLDNEEIKVKTKDGILKPALISARLITINGETCVLAFTRDISEQKRAEEEIHRQNRELQAASQTIKQYADELEKRVAERTSQLSEINQELESLMYTIAHDLRAPLRAISGYSQILLDDYASQFDAESSSYIERIVSRVKRMHLLIDEMLVFSRLSQVLLEIVSVDLSDIALSVSQDLQQRQPEREIEWVIAEGLCANGDKNMLHTVLENLLENAWKFTTLQPKARIEFGTQKTPTKPVYFVRDNGAGFSPDCSERLFGIFQRLHDEKQFPGIGIGLASVKRIIERHGGRVWAESEVDQGATFYFTLSEDPSET